MGDMTKDFSRKEFMCPCCGVTIVDPRLVATLQTIRDHWGRPIGISSGYRCLTHNRYVGSDDTSQHVKGKAADLVAWDPVRKRKRTFTAAERQELNDLVERLNREGLLPHLGGIGYRGYRNGCFHIDVRVNADGHVSRW